MNKQEIIGHIDTLYTSIAELISKAKTTVAITANAELALLNWKVGLYVNEFVLRGDRAQYGKQIVSNLSKMLTASFGGGWGEKYIRHCLRIAETIDEEQIVYAVQRQLSWTHLKTIAYEENPIKRLFYIEMAINQRWNTRKLAEEIDSMLYERTEIARQPEEQIRLAYKNYKPKTLSTQTSFLKVPMYLIFWD